jgi:hypothetical protein
MLAEKRSSGMRCIWILHEGVAPVEVLDVALIQFLAGQGKRAYPR